MLAPAGDSQLPPQARMGKGYCPPVSEEPHPGEVEPQPQSQSVSEPGPERLWNDGSGVFPPSTITPHCLLHKRGQKAKDLKEGPRCGGEGWKEAEKKAGKILRGFGAAQGLSVPGI